MDLGHPVVKGVFEFFGNEAYGVAVDSPDGRTSQLVHAQKPLVAQARLCDGIGVALRISDLVFVIFNLLDQTRFGEILGYLFAHGKAVHAYVHAGSLADGGVVVEYVDRVKVVFLAEHVVVDIMGRGDFQAACAELHVDIIVLDHGYLTANQRHDHTLALEMGVFGIVGIDTHGCVAHNGFRTGGGYNGIPVLADYIIAQIVELAVLLFIDHFNVAQSGLGLGIPVDHPLAAVDKPAAVKIDKYLCDTFRPQFVHGEGGAAPVARGSELAQLLQDDASILVSPVPRVFQKLLACEIALLDSLFGKLGHDFGLCGYRSMVGAGHPQGVFARHAGAAHEYVLYRVVEHVAHVEHACDIGRRDNDRIGFARVGSALEEVVTHPVVIPFVFNLRRVVFGGKLVHFVRMVGFCICLIVYVGSAKLRNIPPPSKSFPPQNRRL